MEGLRYWRNLLSLADLVQQKPEMRAQPVSTQVDSMRWCCDGPLTLATWRVRASVLFASLSTPNAISVLITCNQVPPLRSGRRRHIRTCHKSVSSNCGCSWLWKLAPLSHTDWLPIADAGHLRVRT